MVYLQLFYCLVWSVSFGLFLFRSFLSWSQMLFHLITMIDSMAVLFFLSLTATFITLRSLE